MNLLKWIHHRIKVLFKFLISKFSLRLFGAIIIAASIFFGKYLDEQIYPHLTIGLAIISSVLFLFFDPIVEEIDKFRNKKKRKRVIQNHLKPLSSFLSKNIDINIDIQTFITDIETSDIDYDKRESVYMFVTNQLPNLNQNEKDALLLTALCHEVDREQDILKSERYKNMIASIFERYNFLELDEDAKLIIRYYNNYQNNIRLNSPATQLDFLSKTNELTKKYNKTYNLSLQLKLEKDQAEEFRRTLAILIRDGKLNVKQIEKNLQKRINQELKNKAVSTKAFLVLANKFHKIDGVRKVLQKFPSVVYPYKQPNELPDSIRYLHTRIIYPPSSFQSAEDFLNDEIGPHIPNEEMNEGFIAIIPIEGTELYTLPTKVDKIEKDYLREGFESIAAYKTGVSINMTELYMASMKDEINIDEILANIPFNIFVPSISESRKNFLIENYDNLKSEFQINRLADWATINRDDLKDFLISLDANRDKKRLYKDENWENVANKIIDQAIKHRDAVNN